MPIYEASYNPGLAEEERVLPLLCDYFKRDIQKIPGRFAQPRLLNVPIMFAN